MDICVRVISVFKCHKACPLTSASSISVASFIEGGFIEKELGFPKNENGYVRIGHPSGIMTMYPNMEKTESDINLLGVAVQRTARRIMDGYVYVK